MSLRFYQITALAIIVGGPLLANLVGNAVPATRHAVVTQPERAVEPTPEAPGAADDGLPPPLSEPRHVTVSQAFSGAAEPLVATAPTLDVSGIVPDAPARDAAPAPSEPPAAKPVAPPPEVLLPPRPSVPLSQRY